MAFRWNYEGIDIPQRNSNTNVSFEHFSQKRAPEDLEQITMLNVMEAPGKLLGIPAQLEKEKQPLACLKLIALFSARCMGLPAWFYLSSRPLYPIDWLHKVGAGLQINDVPTVSHCRWETCRPRGWECLWAKYPEIFEAISVNSSEYNVACTKQCS